jgi:hypothetical protein
MVSNLDNEADDLTSPGVVVMVSFPGLRGGITQLAKRRSNVEEQQERG